MLTPEKSEQLLVAKSDVAPRPITDTLDNSLYKPNHIVFLIDASGSMKEDDKLPLLKKAIVQLIEPLRSADFISIISYADKVEVLVSKKSGSEKKALKEVVNSLKAEGVTAGSAGLNKAYELMLQHYIVDGNNQVLLATDGVFRLSASQRKSVETQAKSAERPVILSIVAMGNDDAALNMLTNLSLKGNGNLIHLNGSSEEKTKLILQEIMNRSLR